MPYVPTVARQTQTDFCQKLYVRIIWVTGSKEICKKIATIDVLSNHKM